MGLETVQNKNILLDLAFALSNSKALEAIHLADNQLSFDQEFYEEFLSFFGISTFRDEQDYIRDQKDQNEVAQVFLQMTKNLGNCPNFKYSEDKNFVDLKVYKEYLFKSQQRKNVDL